MERIPFTDGVAAHFATVICILINRDVDCRCITPQYMELTIEDSFYTIYSGEDDSIRVDVPRGNPSEVVLSCIEKFFCKKRVEPIVSSLFIREDEPMEYFHPYESED